MGREQLGLKAGARADVHEDTALPLTDSEEVEIGGKCGGRQVPKALEGGPVVLPSKYRLRV
jgi:hypothetical protein